MGKFAYLIMVDGSNGKNNNKFYKMTELNDGTFEVCYGRVDSTSTKITYPISKWSSKYNSKVKKGYKDITELVSTSDGENLNENTQCLISEDKEINDLINRLQDYAKNTINKFYNVSYTKVTQKMVDSAQKLINDLISAYRENKSVEDLNSILMELYTTIPRKMKNVSDYLFKNTDKSSFEKIVDDEQKLLDTMAGQVMLYSKESVDLEKTKKENETLLTKMGITVKLVENESILNEIKKLMDSSSKLMGKVYEVVNLKTESEYNKVANNDENFKEELLWHGSRNQNWFNILQTGLLIRPAGAIHNGSMFSDGLYFANKARKSLGYTSLSGSYWARGNDNRSYLALFKVNVGNQKHIYKHDYSCYSITESNLKPYNSVYAHGGADLRNDEFIVYNPNRCTIKYLIEVLNN